jgi:hypothetical protein
MVLRGVPRQKEHGARFKIKDNGIVKHTCVTLVCIDTHK